MTSAIRVAHVITSLDTGGAQMMLHKLLTHIDDRSFRSAVISLAPAGPMTSAFHGVAERIESLDIEARPFSLLRAGRLRPILREWKPDIVQTWMYHANVIGGLVARVSGTAPVIWNIRASGYERSSSRQSHTIAPSVRAGALLSRFVPRRIVYCSERAVEFHRQIGYSSSEAAVIANGFDIQAFQPDETTRQSLRRELGIGDDTLLVGLVARFRPIKNHEFFFDAARTITDQRSDTHFVLCGDEMTRANAAAMSLVERHGLGDRCHLLGPRQDIARITAALDIATSSSFGEGFPNSIGEAMACGVPCVATDVGDTAYLIGDTGLVVPRDEPAAFAEACLRLLREPELRARLGREARRRVAEHFEIGAITRRYEALYRDVLPS